jgi:hypothetical protein
VIARAIRAGCENKAAKPAIRGRRARDRQGSPRWQYTPIWGWASRRYRLTVLPSDTNGPCPAATARRLLSPQYCDGYEARRRRAGRFPGVWSCSTLVGGGAFAKAFRSRLALSVATRSIVGARSSTSTRWISSPATFCRAPSGAASHARPRSALAGIRSRIAR